MTLSPCKSSRRRFSVAVGLWSSYSIHLSELQWFGQPWSIHPSIHPPTHHIHLLSIYQFIHLPAHPSILACIHTCIHTCSQPPIYTLSFHLPTSIHPFHSPINQFIHPSTCSSSIRTSSQSPTHLSSIFPFTYLLIHLSIHLSVQPSIHSFHSPTDLSIHPPTHPHPLVQPKQVSQSALHNGSPGRKREHLCTHFLVRPPQNIYCCCPVVTHQTTQASRSRYASY